MRTLTAWLTLSVNALSAGTAFADEPVVKKEATLRGIGFVIVLAALFGVVKIIITGQRMR